MIPYLILTFSSAFYDALKVRSTEQLALDMTGQCPQLRQLASEYLNVKSKRLLDQIAPHYQLRNLIGGLVSTWSLQDCQAAADALDLEVIIRINPRKEEGDTPKVEEKIAKL